MELVEDVVEIPVALALEHFEYFADYSMRNLDDFATPDCKYWNKDHYFS